MAKVGRKKVLDRPVSWNISVPESLATLVELRLYDPVLGKVGYAARSKYIERLMREDIAKNKPETIVRYVPEAGAEEPSRVADALRAERDRK